MTYFLSGVSRRGLLLLLLLGIPFSAVSQTVVDHRPDPRQLFERMRLATMVYSYSGSMTYEHDGQLSSFALSSSGGDGQWRQDIEFLNGPERRFAQNLDPCDLGTLSQARMRISEETRELALYYNFQARGDFRIAGRNAQEIVVMPVDQYRYGYNFAVDTETGLMLHSMTMDSTRKILERFQFVQVAGEPTSEAFEAIAESCMTAEPVQREVEADEVLWRLGWLPAGFDQLASRLRNDRVELVYGDGLATISVIIEPIAQVRFPPATTSVGATSLMLNYYLIQSDTYSVTLVGEVPLMTLQRIASELQYEEANDAG